jgi:plastocyanin
MTARRVVILAAAAIVLILVVTGTYYFVLPHEPSTAVTIVATGGPQEFAFAPANFTVHEGQHVTLVFVNNGSAPHALEIPQLGAVINSVDAGATASVSFVPNKLGTFLVFQPPGAGPVPCYACNFAGYVTVDPHLSP